MGEIGSGGGSSYPTALDTNNTPEVNSPNAGKTKARAEVPNDLAAGVVAIETELGTDPAGTKSDVKTYLQTEHGADGTHAAVTATSLAVSGTANLNGTTNVVDNAFFITDNGDATKKLAFDAANITTGTTRTITVPDADLELDFGTYSPGLAAVANISDVGLEDGVKYTRIGDIVSVAMQVATLDPTAGSTVTQLGISLPIASNLSDAADLNGTSSIKSTGGSSYVVGRIQGDSANDRALVLFYSLDTTAHTLHINFTYKII